MPRPLPEALKRYDTFMTCQLSENQRKFDVFEKVKRTRPDREESQKTGIILGMDLAKMIDAVGLRKTCLIERLWENKLLTKTKPMNTPMNCHSLLRNYYEDLLWAKDAKRNGSIIGSLLYIAIKTIHDLCVNASTIDAHIKMPCKSGLVAAKRAQCILNSKAKREIMLKSGEGTLLSAKKELNWVHNMR